MGVGGLMRRWSRPSRQRGSAGRPVRVRFETRGYGIALAIDENGGVPTRRQSAGDVDHQSGLLRVRDAVVTLEMVDTSGRRSVLAWDPAEVAWSTLLAG